MKTKFNIAFFLLLVTALCGCTEANEQTAEIIAGKGKNVQVSFEVMVPPAGLPSSRAISNDAAIDKYVVWVFNDGAFKDKWRTDVYHTARRIYRCNADDCSECRS